MELGDKNKIQRSIVTLRSIPNIDRLAEELVKSNVIDWEYVDRLKSNFPYGLDYNQEFFLRYTKRGPEAFKILVESMIKVGLREEASKLAELDTSHFNNARVSVSSLESPSEQSDLNVSSGSNGSAFVFGSPGNESNLNSSSENSLNFSGDARNDLPLFRNSVNPIDDHLPLRISVKSATLYNQGRPLDEVYPMMSNPRGFALIVNNIEFAGDSDATRTGAVVDSDNLDTLFQQLGFKTNLYYNVNKEDLIDVKDGILANFMNQFSEVSVDACVVVLMSHGTQNLIRSSDPVNSEIESNHWDLFEDIIKRFNNRYCEVLMHKPKIFIIQACQGYKRDRGVRRTRTDGKLLQNSHGEDPSIEVRNLPSAISKMSVHPENGDILICYSTVPGFVSNRDIEKGTWYIQSLCDIFMKHAHDHEVLRLLSKLGARMGLNESEYGEKQMSSYSNMGFNRELYFNPGLFENSAL